MKYHHILFFIAAAGLATSNCCSPRTKAQANASILMPIDTGHLDVVVPQQPFHDNMPNALQDQEETQNEKVFAHFDRPPEFPGSYNALYKFIESNLKMPKTAKDAGISGRVFLTFTIEDTGEINDIAVLKGLGFGCDEEAMRVVGLMPRWKPGTLYGKPVRVKFNLPVSFTDLKEF
ncbi:MAG: energy transducer TonB [Dyadobacter sp.]|uniref:energy transducer TonB n=1 Tax=Dyadobacter sp. TaxID=1914288 RepID=UPI003263A866